MENERNEDLNSNENGQENNGQEKVELTKEEYEKLLNDQKELWTVRTQLKESTKEWQKLSWISKVAQDNQKFVKLYRSDKRVAEEVAKHFGYSAKDFYDAVIKEYGEGTGDGIEMEDVDERVRQGINEWLAKEKLTSFMEKYGIKWKLQGAFEKEFNELMEWKPWDSDTVLKQAKRALTLISNTAEFQEELNKANSKLAWAGISWGSRVWGKTQPKSSYEKYKESKKEGSLLEKYGIKKDI